MSKGRCIRWEREYANVETRRRVRGIIKSPDPDLLRDPPPGGVPRESWAYRSKQWFMDRKGRARGESLFPREGYLPCPVSIHTARSCKRRMDRHMVIELGTEGSPTGPWECVEYGDE
tara:strand:+ start:534 stop:884 length:351 start_codon:yes stop_codon:yes gene_type:complete